MFGRTVEWMARNQDLLFVAGVVSILFVIFVPMPPALLDFLLVGSITLSVLTLLTAVSVREPVKFSVFPSVILLSTAYRVALNIATTRLILGNGNQAGTSAAGGVVKAFGEFVAGNEPLVGFVIFLILIIVNFIVITKGANRISEVAARFILDAMPGKQLAIDSDLNAGVIKEEEARRRREAVSKQADFYGAMDGATKFIRGDAIAGVLIIAVNILVGFLIGTLRHGMPVSQALSTYTVLTIGDGLVSQVPSLIVSLGAGLLVTRATSESNLGHEFFSQIFSEKKSLIVAAVFLVLLVPTGLPVLPLVAAASILGGLVWTIGRGAKLAEQKKAEEVVPSKPEPVEPLLFVEPLELEIGIGLVRSAPVLLTQVDQLRRDLAAELGFIVPSIRIRDGAGLSGGSYRLRIRGAEVAQGSIPTDKPFELSERLRDVLRSHAAELLTRDDVASLVKTLKEKRPAVVEEVVPALMKPGELQKVLQNLLREGVSIRDLGTILETLGDFSPRTKDPEILTEYVRQSLGRSLCAAHLDGEGRLFVITFDPKLEDLIRGATERTDRGSILSLPTPMVRSIVERVTNEVKRLVEAGHTAVILCAPAVRAQVGRMAELIRPAVRVLSYNEVLEGVRVESLGMVTVE